MYYRITTKNDTRTKKQSIIVKKYFKEEKEEDNRCCSEMFNVLLLQFDCLYCVYTVYQICSTNCHHFSRIRKKKKLFFDVHPKLSK